VESNVFCTESSEGRIRPSVLAIGGLDPSGGAGVVIDAAAARAAGAHAAVVVAVTTVQTGRAFGAASAIEPAAVLAAIQAVLGAHEVRAVKVGALGSAGVAEIVAELGGRPGFPPLIVDPVLESTTGGALVDAAGSAVLRRRVVPLAAIVTPNLAEAAALTGEAVDGVDGMLRAGLRLLDGGCRAVLVKGGHLPGEEVVDVFLDRRGKRRVFRQPRLPGGEVRGTGCALASLVAAHLALGCDLEGAVVRARAALRRAIAAAYEIGPGARILDFNRRRTSARGSS
jgi:hydroxymethylpyrimidine/phosphomethylpyrimidine kinase